MAHANGERGVAAFFTTHDAAHAAARAAAQTEPTSLLLYLGANTDLAVVIATGDPAALTVSMRTAADPEIHRTATRSFRRHRRTWPIGDATPGVTQLYVSQRRPGLSQDDYHRHWEREHGPRALRHHMGMWDYAQVSVVDTITGHAIDGITVTQWPNLDELALRSTDDAVGRGVIQQDAGNFTDLATLERNLMTEHILIERPWPVTGSVNITDARHLEFDVPADAVWAVLGQFGALDSWWPAPFAGIEATSELGVGMTRTMTRLDGSLLIERLFDYRPDERMFHLAIDAGLPNAIENYTCRYEVRPLTETSCRLDWFPRGRVRADSLDTFGAVVDRGWPMVAEGLTAAVSS
jgi:hypothetical protein